MKELFLALCAFTSLNCNEITLGYGFIGFDVEAIAVMDVNNKYYIIINNDLGRKSKSEKKQILAHEIAHLILYDNNIISNKHDKVYLETCKNLTHTLNLNYRSTCQPLRNRAFIK
jgi:hypothetical protein